MTKPKTGDMSVEGATAMLARMAQQAGYHYQPISADWHTLCNPFFKRLFGHNQITDAYLLGLGRAPWAGTRHAGQGDYPSGRT